ncbi:MAG TPA: MDR family MFS transporter [Streptosporangiaceae bacterium]|nr:MDR family MFS transporter [Streptosporangiaceae bacterium]
MSQTTSTLREDAPRAEPLDPQLVRLALAVLVGVIAAILDLTIVNVAIDTLQHRLHTSVSTIQWVSTGYMLALAMTIPVSGWAFERFGGRRPWMIALTVFAAGSALSGLAWSAGSLIVFRVLQGIGGGMLLPLATTILASAAGRERLARVVPYIAIPSQLGPALGPVIGGAILSNASWRWIFYVNIPIVIAALFAARRTVPETVAHPGRRLDVRGLALLSPALALLVYGFSQAGESGGFGHAQVIAPLVAGLALLGGYCAHALRSRIDPPLNIRLLRARGYATSSAMMFASGVTLFGALFLLPLYYQQARGASALEAGLLLAPQGVGVAIGSLAAGRLVDKLKTGVRAPALGGMVLLALTTIPFAFAGAHASEVLLSLAVCLRGVGLGLALIPVTTASYIGLPHSAIPSVTTGVRIFQQVGGALGTAVLAVILQHAISAAPGGSAAGGSAAGVLAHAFDTTFAWVLGLTVLSFVPALLLPGRDRR